MRRKKEVVEGLLESLSILEKFYQPPEKIHEQFTTWLNSVSAILDGSDMREESDIWTEAMKGIRFSDDESLVIIMLTAKATLIRILNKLESTEIFKTPYLKDEDVLSAYRMSELYVILHCYENSVRRFIDKVLSEKLGDTWWEQVANNKLKDRVRGRQEKEQKDRWVSPRGTSPLYYVQWGDLVTLIRSQEALFIPYIGSLKFVENRLEDLENLRNIVAHNGVIPSDDDFQRAILAYRDWCRQIGYS